MPRCSAGLLALRLFLLLAAALSVAGLRVAVLLTGQLARLELASKVEFVVGSLLADGHAVVIFACLDNTATPRQTNSPDLKFATGLYSGCGERALEHVVRKAVEEVVPLPPGSTAHSLVVTAVYTNGTRNMAYEPVGNRSAAQSRTEAEGAPEGTRFQNNFHWLNGMRTCYKRAAAFAAESPAQRSFDVFLRIRDDSWAFAPFRLLPSEHTAGFTSLRCDAARGTRVHCSSPLLRRCSCPYPLE